MKIYNSYSKTKEEFYTLSPNQVKMYVCGQTVYDYCHLGHARKEVVFDMIRKWFIANGYEVIFVENITDIDDKIINRAIINKESIESLTAKYIKYMHEDFDTLGIMRPSIEPYATHYIDKMINLIDDLVNKGFAYQASNNDVYYRVNNFENYGKLSGENLDSLIQGERVEIDKNKENPLDFVLWKSSKENEPFWDSKFGKGRPGWHIECSAMAEDLLGKTFDIHGGGLDLKFPHHENEIAQSEAHNNCRLANFWMHNGFLRLNDEKMSKSLGNILTLRDALKIHHPEVIRFFMLKTHYRSPLNFDLDLLEDTKNVLTKLYLSLKNSDYTKELSKNINWNNEFAKKFKEAMDDDFNTPLAITVLFEIQSILNKTNDIIMRELLISLANTIGLLNQDPNEFLQYKITDSNVVEEKIAQRNDARKNKNFSLADSIREELLSKGIILEDNKDGTTSWRQQ